MKDDIKMAILKINMERVHKTLHHAIGVAYGLEEPTEETKEQKARNAKFKGACGGAFDFLDEDK